MHDLLDRHVGSGVFQLIPDGRHVFSFIEHRTVKGGKQLGQLADPGLSCHDGLHVDEGQGIIEKMGIDLRLQDPKLIFLLSDLCQQHFIDHMIQLLHHVPKSVLKASHLILSRRAL